jgi:carboxymethylenebutenolidase
MSVMNESFTAEERRLIELWERHMRYEFLDRDAAATVATMSRENYVNHVPVLTGGRGPEEMFEFYSRHFIPKARGYADYTSMPDRWAGADCR